MNISRKSPGGEIGRHARFRFWYREVCRFESYPGQFFFILNTKRISSYFSQHRTPTFFSFKRGQMKSSVIGIVFSKDKREIVAIKRCDVPVWVFPGGGIEKNESAEEAVLREVREETGLAVSIVRKIGEYTPSNRLTNFTHLFECQVNEGSLETGPETRDIGFFSISRLPHPFVPVHKHWLDDALLEQDELIKRPISGASWLHFMKYIITHPLLMVRYILSLVGLTINSRPAINKKNPSQ